MPASQSDLFKKVGASTVTTLSAPGKALGATSLTVGSTTNYPTDTGIIVAIRVVDTSGNLVAGTYTEWSATVSSGTSLSINATPVYGSDQIYAAGSTTQVFIPVSSYATNKLVDGLLVEHKQTGKHGDITADSAIITNATITNLTVGSQTTPNDYTSQAILPTSVAYNGQGSYTLTYPSSVASFKSAGQRNRIVRTVAAPTQSTSLNGTNQYWVKTSPNKLTFTDGFVIDANIKITSYKYQAIVTRFNGTSGWSLILNANGQIILIGYNASNANYSQVMSYQSVPLNKCVRITTQLDMSAFTATTTTSYVMIDGVNVPCSVSRGGTNPTALIQAGNLEVGSENGLSYLSGKIYQVAIYNAKVTQANIIATHSQGLTGSETSLASAYSFNGVATDLNTTTPNDLTAMNSAGYVTGSPFGNNGVSSTVEYAMTQLISSDGLTEVMQVPEGCAIPTTGGISAMSYSGLKTPYLFPSEENKWELSCFIKASINTGAVGANVITNIGGLKLTVPIGAWKDLKLNGSGVITHAGIAFLAQRLALSTSSSAISDDELNVLGNASSTSSSQTSTPFNIGPKSIDLSSATPYYLLTTSGQATTTQYIALDFPLKISTTNSYL